MKRFEYLDPHSLEEALEMLRQQSKARPLAGGTDILVQMKERQREVSALLSLKHIPELHCFEKNGDSTIGAAVTMSRLADDSDIQREQTALACSAALVGSIQIRNMATVGGNLCNASPSADTAPPLIVLGAEAIIAGLNGEKRIMMEEFFLGPGMNALQPGELLKEIHLPARPERSGSFYLRHTPRAWMDLAFASVAAAVTLDEQGRINQARLALGAVAPTPIRAFVAEEVLEGQAPSEDLLAEAGTRAAAICQPIDDLRASAEYRRHLVNVLTQRALRQAIQRAEGKNGA